MWDLFANKLWDLKHLLPLSTEEEIFIVSNMEAILERDMVLPKSTVLVMVSIVAETPQPWQLLQSLKTFNWG